MGIMLFVMLALLAAAAIAYPLLPGRYVADTAAGVSDEEIDGAVRRLRRARAAGGQACMKCGQPYQPGDAFCVRCGAALSQAGGPPAARAGRVCAACGAPLKAGDEFCAKCGQRAGEVA